MTQDTRPPVGSTGTLDELQVGPGDVVRFMTGHEYEITRVSDGSDVDFEAKRTRVPICRDQPKIGDLVAIGDPVTINNAREDWTLISRATPDQPAHIITHNGREYDLYTLETPVGLLPEPVQVAMQAWPHGLEIMTYSGQMIEYNFPDLSGKRGAVWRAKPAPVEDRVPCQRSAWNCTREQGTCIKRADGSIDWTTWEPSE